jgi:3-phosphoshikimate 1-carboxyvinyltransferase
MAKSIAYREVGGRLRAPASKSSMQRAVACALLAAGGESVLRNPSRSADCLAALGVARALGASVEDGGEVVALRGVRRLPASPAARFLSCGESGLCIRMFSPIAALFEGEIELRAEGSLRSRPVGMITPPLVELGAECSTASGLPPVRVRGPLRGGWARVDGRESSQFLTGLLIALPLAGQDSVLEVEGLASRGYVDLTLGTMRAFGVQAERDEGFGRFSIPGGQSYREADFQVEGDWSGAAFLLVAGAIAATRRPLEVEGLNPRSAQPDRAILAALRAAGARIEESGGLLSVTRDRLLGFDFDAADCPDLFPPLVALALACSGESRIRGALRLKGKESDRAAALRGEFAALGGSVEVEGDLMTLRGRGRLAGGVADSRGDHRIAMAAAVASLVADAPVEIEGSDCVSKSWPSFFEDLARIAG